VSREITSGNTAFVSVREETCKKEDISPLAMEVKERGYIAFSDGSKRNKAK